MKIKTLCRSGRQRCHFSIKIGKIVRKSDPDPQNVDHYLCVCVSRGGGGGGGRDALVGLPPARGCTCGSCVFFKSSNASNKSKWRGQKEKEKKIPRK